MSEKRLFFLIFGYFRILISDTFGSWFRCKTRNVQYGQPPTDHVESVVRPAAHRERFSEIPNATCLRATVVKLVDIVV